MGRKRKIPLRYAILVVCEGEQTEKHYFNSFSSRKLHVNVQPYVGDPRQIVLRAELLKAKKAYDETWVVFDLDYNPSRGREQYNEFHQALALARKLDIGVAYSIDAFELWFRLHYESVSNGLSRKALYKDLSRRWGINYESDGKREQFAKSIFGRLAADEDADIELALQRAEKLWGRKQHLPIEEQNPITTVHLLVKKLLAFA